MNILKNAIINQEKTIKEAMKKIDENGIGTVFIINEEESVCGISTDGDIRRAILNGVDIEEKIKEIMRKDFFAIKEEDLDNKKILEELLEGLSNRAPSTIFIPILDKGGRLEELIPVSELKKVNVKAELLKKKESYINLARDGKKILVVGGAGYLGSVLVRKLLERGYNVRILDIFLFGEESLADIANDSRVEIVRGDVRDIRIVSDVISGVDSVIHLAAIVGDPACKSKPIDAIETNYLATKALAEVCKYHQINRLIFASTCSVYGHGEGKLTEISPLNPISLYAKSKIKSEQGILDLVDKNFSPCILRMGTLYGLSKRMRFDLVVNTLTMKAVHEKKIDIFGGNQWRPLLHVEDAAEAYIKCLESPVEKIKGEIFNVGSTGQNYQIFKLGEIVKKIVPDVEINKTKSEIINGELDSRDYDVCFDKIYNILNYSTKKNVEEGVLEIKKMLESGIIKNPYDEKYYNLQEKDCLKENKEDKVIPYAKQLIDDQDIQEVVRVLKSDWLTTGPKVREFEEKFANYVGAKYAVAAPNGTAALHLACMAIYLKEGDELITTPMTFASSANCALFCNAVPVFADIDKNQGLINSKNIEGKITSKTRAIIPVHYTGLSCDMEKIKEIAEKYNLSVIEDACHALGARYKDSKIGDCKYSDMTIFSFHPVKHITTGEGGMITTNSKELYSRLILLRTHGITKDPNLLINKDDGDWYYEMQELSNNYRITDIQCGLGVSQLRKVDKFIKRRREIALRYDSAFRLFNEIESINENTSQFNSYHLYIIKLKNSEIRRKLFDYLKKNKIFCQVHYIPVYWHPFYQKQGYKKGLCPNSEEFYEKILSLPMYPGLTPAEQDYVIEKIKDFFENEQSRNNYSG